MRRGKVALVNTTRSMVGVLTADDGYTVFEMLDADDFEPGDELKWSDDYGLGETTITNSSKDFRCMVYMENHGVSQANLRSQLLF